MLDIAVIGSGPAGLSAAINAIQRDKTVSVFGKSIMTSFIYKAEDVDNYLGLSHLTGKQMMEEFYSHAKKKGVSFQEGRVLQILPMEEYYLLNVDNRFIEAKAVIFATGLEKKKTIPGEEQYLGSGVSYCATCDGMLYRNKEVIVVGEEPEAENDAVFLSGICKKVFYLPLYPEFQPFSDKVEVLKGRPKEVVGEETVSGLLVGETMVPCKGIFFIKEDVPLTSLIPGLTMDGRSIKVNRFMETNLKHIYAAGDCTGKPFQVAKAVGEGLVAALQAANALEAEKKKK